MLREKLEEFARKELTHDDHVVIEAAGNSRVRRRGSFAIRRSGRGHQPEAT